MSGRRSSSRRVLIFNQNGQQVAVAEDGVARLRKITVFRYLGTEIEVRDGVNAGDRVILIHGESPS